VEGKDALCTHQEIAKSSYSIDSCIYLNARFPERSPFSSPRHHPPTVLLIPFTPSRPQELSHIIYTSSVNFIRAECFTYVRRPRHITASTRSNHHRRSAAFPAVSILQLIPSTTHDPRQKHEFIEEGITRRQEWPVSQPATRSSYVSYLFSIIPQMMLATTVPCH
jgi:hypothetical protein